MVLLVDSKSKAIEFAITQTIEHIAKISNKNYIIKQNQNTHK